MMCHLLILLRLSSLLDSKSLLARKDMRCDDLGSPDAAERRSTYTQQLSGKACIPSMIAFR